LRHLEGKSADFVNADRYLRTPLVFPRAQQDLAQMAEEVRPRRAELVLGHVPREMREGRRKLERLEDRPFLLAHSPELEPARREVVRITPPPRSLRPRSPRRLA